MGAITIRGYTLSDFVAELRAQSAYLYRIEAAMLHHTWSPTTAQDRGLTTVQGIQRAHMANGADDGILANAYCSNDGRIYNGRPLRYANWAHAAKLTSHPWSKVDPALAKLMDGDRMWCNHHAFGIETIGNFDTGHDDPRTSKSLSLSLDLIAAILKLRSLPVERVFFHHDVDPKTCPGTAVSKAWVREQLRARLSTDALRVVLLPGSTVIDCHPAVDAGVTRCDLRPLAEGLGYEVIADHLNTQRKLYLREVTQ